MTGKARGVRNPEGMRSVRQLATGIAHEVNNILGAIIGNAHLAKGKLDADHPAQAFVTAIRDASEDGRLLMADLGRLASEQTLRKKPTDINDIVARALRDLPDGLSCRTSLGDKLPPVILDPALAVSVVRGVIEFGARSSGPEGQTDVATALVGEGDEQLVEIAVSDEGATLPDDLLETACEPFAELPRRPKVGLRLTRALDLAYRFDGRLDVTSRSPRGLTVTLSFPAS